MRMWPFIAAGEQPRPFSEILAERAGADPTVRVLDRVAELEGAADAATDPAERIRLLCAAEELRCSLAERPR